MNCIQRISGIAVIIVVVVHFAAASVAGEPHGQHLEIPDSPLSMMVAPDYHSDVRHVLFKDGSNWSRAGMIALPSFTPEWAVFLSGSSKKPAHITLVAANEIIYHAEARREVETTSHTVTIPDDLAEALNQAWLAMLRRARAPTHSKSFLDGTTYHFWAWGRGEGQRTGAIHSPPLNSPCGRLVHIGKLLRSLVEASSEEKEQLLSEVRAATHKLLESEVD